MTARQTLERPRHGASRCAPAGPRSPDRHGEQGSSWEPEQARVGDSWSSGVSLLPVELSSFDMNLLVVLDALLSTRSVQAASRRVRLSPSATSHALKRLRDAFGDPLLVREKGGLVLTARAEALREPLREALRTLQTSLEGAARFEPSQARRTFSIASADYAYLMVLPSLFARLQREAPGIELWARDPPRDELLELLAHGDVELLLAPGGFSLSSQALRRVTLFEERFVCVVREGHPRVKGKMSLATFLSLPHALIAPGQTRGGIVDEVLAKLGKSRRVALTVPHFLVAPHVIARTDLVLTLAERVAHTLAGILPLQVLEPPIEIPTFTIDLIWHERFQRDEGHAWLRGVIRRACKG